jgi:hypothetical protein
VTLPPGQHPIDGFPRFGTHLHRPPPAVPIDPVIEISGAVAKSFALPLAELAGPTRQPQPVRLCQHQTPPPHRAPHRQADREPRRRTSDQPGGVAWAVDHAPPAGEGLGGGASSLSPSPVAAALLPARPHARCVPLRSRQPAQSYPTGTLLMTLAWERLSQYAGRATVALFGSATALRRTATVITAHGLAVEFGFTSATRVRPDPV